jgi:two-component system response regulator
LKTILLVDDDANDVFLLRHAMKKAGLTNPMQVVSDGQEAIDYLKGAGKFADRETFPVPILLLMDLKLPYVMGLDVLRWIRTQPGMPLIVVMLTASAEGSDIAEAYQLGANAFLTKPSEANKLEDMVKAIKAFWLTHNTLPSEPSARSLPQRTFSLVFSRETTPVAKSLFHGDGLEDRAGNGHRHRDPLRAKSCLHQRQAQGPQDRSKSARSLTNRQMGVLQLIAQGYTSRDIARQFSLSIKTIEKHRQALMDKLDIHEVATLTRYAVSTGLVAGNLGPEKGSGAIAARQGREAAVGLRADVGKTS